MAGQGAGSQLFWRAGMCLPSFDVANLRLCGLSSGAWSFRRTTGWNSVVAVSSWPPFVGSEVYGMSSQVPSYVVGVPEILYALWYFMGVWLSMKCRNLCVVPPIVFASASLQVSLQLVPY